MPWKRKVTGGIVALIGFVLSPLSWWNDLFVNIPLAAGFGWLVSLVYPPAFEVSVVVGYWLTNVLGFVLMHKGANRAFSNPDEKPPAWDWKRDIGISLLYTLIIIALIKLGVLKPITDYFNGQGGA